MFAEAVHFFSRFIDWASTLFHTTVEWVVNIVSGLGYPGVTVLMFLESSFVPFPSEVVIPPAGYLAYTGQMNLAWVIVSGVLGSLLGALFNYWIAVKWGRRFFEKFGRYFFVTPASLDKAEAFFAKHGAVSTFTGRLLPVIRQYISLPAGVARMPLLSFCLFTALGAGIWVVVLALLGYWIGDNKQLLMENLHTITLALIFFCIVIVTGYVIYHRRKKTKKDSP